jgi:type III secretion protein C
VNYLKVKNINRFDELWLHIIMIMFLFGTSLLAKAADIPNFDHSVTVIAREQPIESFLKELFSQISLPVIVDESVTGNVNGSFERMEASRVFSDVAKSFGLVIYYDGAVVYVYTSSNITRRIMPASKTISRRIVKAANELDMTDGRNTIRRASEGGLVITGTRRFVEQIDELMYAAEHNLQTYEPPVGFKVFYLKYAWAQDVTMTFAGRQVVIPGVATILRELLEDVPRSYTIDHSRDAMISPTLPGLRGKGLNSIGKDERIGLPDNPRLYSINKTQVLDTDVIPVNNTINNIKSTSVRIQADPRLNAIIVRDSPERMSRYKYLIDALDVEPQMLEIEATIIDINTDKMRKLGINWRWQNDEDEVLFGNGSESDLRLTSNGQITPSGNGGFISFVLGDNAKFISRINALEAKGAAHVVSRPNVLTLSNVEAIFDTSSTFFVRVAGREEVDLFNISVGTSLRVTPHVFKDEGVARIKLLVTIEDGQQRDQSVDGIPIIERSAINTQALINAGESVLIGGLVREKTSDSENKVPLLGDLPVMGNLFKSTEKGTVRIERLFLISPTLSIHRMAKNVDTSKLTADQIKQEKGGMDMEKATTDDEKNSGKGEKVPVTHDEESWNTLIN